MPQNCNFNGNPPYDCTGCDLSNRDLSAKDLRGAILRDTILLGTIFKGVAGMAGADLTGATMGEGTDFSGLDLSGVCFGKNPVFGNNPAKPVRLIGAKLSFRQLGPMWRCLDLTDAALLDIPDDISELEVRKSNLTRLNLSGKKLKNAHFYECVLKGLKLAGSDLSNAIFSDRCDLTAADLSDTISLGCVFDRAILTSVNFFKARLDGASFKNARMDGTRFESTDVTSCEFSSPPSLATGPDNLTSFKNTKILFSTLGREWSYLDLRNTEIVGLDASVSLDHLQAQYTILSGRNFTGYQLKEANLSRATLDNCIFDNAVMSSARLKVVKGIKTSFKGAILDKAHFGYDEDEQTVLKGVDFTSAQLNGAIFSKADLSPYKPDKTAKAIPSKFNFAVMTNMEFSMANLTEAELTGGVLMHNTNFTSANFKNADLTGAQMGSFSTMFQERKGADKQFTRLDDLLQRLNPYGMDEIFRSHNYTLSPKDTKITEDIKDISWTIADSSVAKQYNALKWISPDGVTAIIISAPVKGATLSGAVMSNTKLIGADLRNVNAAEVQLYGPKVELTSAKLQGVNFSNGNLASINMNNAMMNNAVLSRTNLIGTDLTGADLTGASMEYAHLQGAIFKGTNLDSVNLTNAAVSVDIQQTSSAGVCLFRLTAASPDHTAVLKELESVTAPVILVKDTDAGIGNRIQQLDNGDMAGLAAAIETIRATFSRDAVITVIEKGKGWRINDPQKEANQNEYIVWDGFDAKGKRAILLRQASEKLSKLFEETASLKLRYQAVVIRNKNEEYWGIDNDTFNPGNLQLGYMNFQVVRESNNTLSFYGTNIRVQQLNPAGKMEIVMRSYKSTNFARKGEKTQDCLPDGSGSVYGPDTICPNTLKFSTNQADNKSWAEVLRAPTLPKPPDCVPTPISGCS